MPCMTPVFHDDTGVLKGLSSPFNAARYHSLVVDRETFPEELEITAWTEDGTVMALRHRDLPIEGVQFHPESIITETGMKIVQNWIESL